VGRYVLVHGAWHTGEELGAVAAAIRAAGHDALTPTIAGNRAARAELRWNLCGINR